VPADLRWPDPFAAVDPGPVTRIVHSAARTAFNVTREDAQAVNVNGTVAAAAFAHRCTRLERFLVLSTLFTAGRRTGRIDEAPHDPGHGFVNEYEWSKAEAEAHLLATCAGLPLTVARLATVVADGEDGHVSQFNAFHNTLKLFFYGLLSLMPGDPKTPVYLASAEFTSVGAARLLDPGVPGGIYHLAPGPDEAVPLGDLVDLAFSTFERDPAFARRRLLRPEFCDIDSFRDLIAGSRAISGSPMGQALASVAPFAEQMFLPKEFTNSRLRAAWPGYPEASPLALAEAATSWLVRTRWGRSTEETP
jgi:nucleoside-diphosphate-sugar epimerase